MGPAETIVSKYAAFIPDDRIFFAPRIPPDKLYNACQVYARLLAPNEWALVLVDNTLFYSAKDGLLITGDKVYMHDTWKDPKVITFKDMVHPPFVSQGNIINPTKIVFSPAHSVELQLLSKDRLPTLAQMLNEIREAVLNPERRTGNEEKGIFSKSDSLRCRSCGAPASQQRAICEYCESPL